MTLRDFIVQLLNHPLDARVRFCSAPDMLDAGIDADADPAELVVYAEEYGHRFGEIFHVDSVNQVDAVDKLSFEKPLVVITVNGLVNPDVVDADDDTVVP